MFDETIAAQSGWPIEWARKNYTSTKEVVIYLQENSCNLFYVFFTCFFYVLFLCLFLCVLLCAKSVTGISYDCYLWREKSVPKTLKSSKNSREDKTIHDVKIGNTLG